MGQVTIAPEFNLFSVDTYQWDYRLSTSGAAEAAEAMAAGPGGRWDDSGHEGATLFDQMGGGEADAGSGLAPAVPNWTAGMISQALATERGRGRARGACERDSLETQPSTPFVLGDDRRCFSGLTRPWY